MVITNTMPSPGENSFARRQQLGAAGHDDLDQLPPLEFKQLHVSEQPVGKFVDPVAPGQPQRPPSTIQAKPIKQVQHYDNFTAVISDDGTIAFFDSRAHAESVPEKLFDKTIGYTLTEISAFLNSYLKKTGRTTVLGPQGNSGSYTAPIAFRELPAFYSSFFRLRLSQHRLPELCDSAPINSNCNNGSFAQH